MRISLCAFVFGLGLSAPLGAMSGDRIPLLDESSSRSGGGLMSKIRGWGIPGILKTRRSNRDYTRLVSENDSENALPEGMKERAEHFLQLLGGQGADAKSPPQYIECAGTGKKDLTVQSMEVGKDVTKTDLKIEGDQQYVDLLKRFVGSGVVFNFHDTKAWNMPFRKFLNGIQHRLGTVDEDGYGKFVPQAWIRRKGTSLYKVETHAAPSQHILCKRFNNDSAGWFAQNLLEHLQGKHVQSLRIDLNNPAWDKELLEALGSRELQDLKEVSLVLPKKGYQGDEAGAQLKEALPEFLKSLGKNCVVGLVLPENAKKGGYAWAGMENFLDDAQKSKIAGLGIFREHSIWVTYPTSFLAGYPDAAPKQLWIRTL